jgi:hypothetical protein
VQVRRHILINEVGISLHIFGYATYQELMRFWWPVQAEVDVVYCARRTDPTKVEKKRGI